MTDITERNKNNTETNENLLDKYGIFIYSSHKTSTQSLISIFNKFQLNSIHIHVLNNFNNYLKTNIKISPDYFLKLTNNYILTNKAKLPICSIIRNPFERLISSFFQSYDTDERNFCNKIITTCDTSSEEELTQMFVNHIINNDLPGKIESIDELSSIMNVNIINYLEKKDDYYYYENDLLKLYVLDFNKVISNNNLEYLNKILNINLQENCVENISKNKPYYNKYNIIKSNIQKMPYIYDIIKERYNPFYFNAFSYN